MDTVQPIAAVIFVLAFLGGALFLLRKRGAASFSFPRLSPAAPRRMEVIERVALGPQQALHLVRIGDRELVVATAAGSCTFISETQVKERTA